MGWANIIEKILVIFRHVLLLKKIEMNMFQFILNWNVGLVLQINSNIKFKLCILQNLIKIYQEHINLNFQWDLVGATIILLNLQLCNRKGSLIQHWIVWKLRCIWVIIHTFMHALIKKRRLSWKIAGSKKIKEK